MMVRLLRAAAPYKNAGISPQSCGQLILKRFVALSLLYREVRSRKIVCAFRSFEGRLKPPKPLASDSPAFLSP